MNEARCHAAAHVIGLANSHLHFMFNGIHLSHALNPYVSNVFVARRAYSLMMSTWHAVQWRHQTKSSAQMYSVLVLGQYCDSWFDWMIDCLGIWMFFHRLRGTASNCQSCLFVCLTHTPTELCLSPVFSLSCKFYWIHIHTYSFITQNDRTHMHKIKIQVKKYE